MKWISASSVIFLAYASKSEIVTLDFPSISFCYEIAFASAFAYPELLIDSHSACKLYNSFFFSSALASSSIFFFYNAPLASCSYLSAFYFANASCILVVISIASVTDFYNCCFVFSSTGSTLWMSTFVTIKLLFENTNSSFTLPSVLSPKMDPLII
jgi:hypothetical protein